MGDIVNGPKINYGEVKEQNGGISKSGYFPEMAAHFLEISAYETATWSMFFLSLGFEADDEITITDHILMQGYGSASVFEGKLISKKRGEFSIEFMNFSLRPHENEKLKKQFIVKFVDQDDLTRVETTRRYIYLGLNAVPTEMMMRKVGQVVGSDIERKVTAIYESSRIELYSIVGSRLVKIAIKVAECDQEKAPLPTKVRLSYEADIVEYLEELDPNTSIEDIYKDVTVLFEKSHLVAESFVIEKQQAFPAYSGHHDVTDRIVLAKGEIVELIKTDDKHESRWVNGRVTVNTKREYESGGGYEQPKPVENKKAAARVRLLAGAIN